MYAFSTNTYTHTLCSDRPRIMTRTLKGITTKWHSKMSTVVCERENGIKIGLLKGLSELN